MSPAPAAVNPARLLFPTLEHAVWLRMSRQGPLAAAGATAIAEALEPGTPAWHERFAALEDALRARFATLIGAPPRQVAISASVTSAFRDVLRALLVASRRRTVLVARPDHAWLAGLCEPWPEVEVVAVGRPGQLDVPPEAFCEALDARRTAIVVAAQLSVTGALHDLRALIDATHAAGAYCVIDGSPSAGCLPVDVSALGCDAFIAGCERWLCGGGAALAFSGGAPEAPSALRTRELRSETAHEPHDQLTALQAALAGIDAVLATGVESIRERVRELTGALLERAADGGLDALTPREVSGRCGVAAFACRQAGEVAAELGRGGIEVDHRDQLLLLAPHWALTDAELAGAAERLLDATMPAGPAPARFPAYAAPLDRIAATGSRREVIRYGPHPDQFAEVWRPAAVATNRLAVLVHGGFWRRRYRLDIMNALAADLRDRGHTVWNVEYRRLASAGSAWPDALTDIAQAVESAIESAPVSPLPEIIVIGHSAGGQLALMLAAAAGRAGDRLAERLAHARIVSLAGITDVAAAVRLHLSDDAATRVFGVGGARSASPLEALPLGVAQLIVHGTADEIVPPALSVDYHRAALAAGDRCVLLTLDGVGHLELIDASTAAWQAVASALEVPGSE